MIAGLEAVAKRAEEKEAREEARRKGGGKLAANVALHVDDVGNRWKRNVYLGIAAAAFLVLAAGAWMVYRTAHKDLDPRTGNADAHKMLSFLANIASRSDFLKEGEKITAQTVKGRLKDEIEANYKKVVEQIEVDHQKRIATGQGYRGPDPGLAKDKDWLEKLRPLQDAWGQPFKFELDGDTLKISAVGKKTPTATPPEPVVVPLRKSAAATEKGKQ
ncbi:MAG: hypothetical protein ABSE73_29305 [Planctomycetota bacterium]